MPHVPGSSSIESRRRAVADALRRDAADARVTALVRRLDVIEAAVFDTSWDAPTPPSFAEEMPVDATPAVPAVALGDVRMSSAAAKALFGG